MSTAWIIASGKGGVGKSTITTNVGLAMAQAGKKVCIVDGDIGLRDLDILLGLENLIAFDMLDVAQGNCTLEEALISPQDCSDLSLLPANQFARAKELRPDAFRRIIARLKMDFDVVLIDCPAGIERSLRGLLNQEIDECIIVCTPDDVCMRNAERTFGLLTEKNMPRPKLIVNRLDEALIRADEMLSAAAVAASLDLELLGEIPEDSYIYRALLSHESLMNIDCDARSAMLRITKRMLGEEDAPAMPGYGTQRLPWYRRWFEPTLKEVKRIDR